MKEDRARIRMRRKLQEDELGRRIPFLQLSLTFMIMLPILIPYWVRLTRGGGRGKRIQSICGVRAPSAS